jgi:predicted lipid-binding transport protein (Tim44 family)
LTSKKMAGGLLAGGAAGITAGAAGGIAAGAIAGVIMKYTYDRYFHGKPMRKKHKFLSFPFKKPTPSIVKTIYPKRPTSVCFSVCF